MRAWACSCLVLLTALGCTGAGAQRGHASEQSAALLAAHLPTKARPDSTETPRARLEAGIASTAAAADGVGTPAPEPALAAASGPFAGRTTVSYGELVVALRQIADELSSASTVQDAYAALRQEFAFSEAELSLQSFSRVRLVFEAARDGGLWDLRWAITDQLPRSDRIWEQWAAQADVLEQNVNLLQGESGPSAIAECDELSALFTLLARDIGVDGSVALHWPVWNHVVAVWEVPRANGKKKARIVVPTSQIFLSPEATLGTQQLATRRVVFPYRRHDLEQNSELRGALARYLVARARGLGGLSTAELSDRRKRLGGS